ncbi:unnamed protein product, partial [Bubo scandiacus]
MPVGRAASLVVFANQYVSHWSCLQVMGPKLNTVVKVWPHQCLVQGDDHFTSPAGCTVSDTSQDANGHLGTLLAHIHLAVDQHPQALFHQAAFQPLFPKPIALHGGVMTQGWTKEHVAFILIAATGGSTTLRVKSEVDLHALYVPPQIKVLVQILQLLYLRNMEMRLLT